MKAKRWTWFGAAIAVAVPGLVVAQLLPNDGFTSNSLLDVALMNRLTTTARNALSTAQTAQTATQLGTRCRVRYTECRGATGCTASCLNSEFAIAGGCDTGAGSTVGASRPVPGVDPFPASGETLATGAYRFWGCEGTNITSAYAICCTAN